MNCVDRQHKLMLRNSAAIIHYSPTRGDCSIIDPEKVYLCDSGGQYFDGTTDTTRTIHHGKPTSEERRAYTLVLKGLIALEAAIFPRETTGLALDCLARQFLRVSEVIHVSSCTTAKRWKTHY